MSRPMTCDAIVFDVGGTLLNVTADPQERAVQRVSHLGTVELDAFRLELRNAVADWQRVDGDACREDLAETWIRHYERALAAARFSGDCAAAARIIEDGFLIDGWEVFPDVAPMLDALGA